jgi:hypothetical protein
MQRFVLIICLAFILPFGINAQQLRGVCGNTDADHLKQMDRYLSNLKIARQSPSKPRNAVTYIPIQFHIITKNNGSGGVQITEVLEQLCQLNELFSAFDVVFYQSDLPNYIPSDVIYDNHTVTSGQFTMRQRRDRESLNVWAVNNASSSSSPPIGETLGYYDPVNDWIVIKRDQIVAANNTLAHEIGHFFSLFHPHFGWDSDPYDMAKHGNPVTATAPNGGSSELVDRSNCQTAGDMLCDTPADYNFGLTSSGCNYNADVKDAKGTKVDPDETLIMSYFSDECTSNFTPSQVDLMLVDIAQPRRNFLRTNSYTPLATEITDTPVLLAPAEGTVTTTYNKVYLKWQAVAGADSYLVEVDRSSGFNIDNFKFITTETLLLVDDLLDANKNYRWRVTPLNASYTCAAPSETIKFKTGLSTSVSSIKKVDSWTIQPNPISESASINITINASESFEANLKIHNLTGQLVKQVTNYKFNKGQSNLSIESKNLNKGIYLLTLENEQGVLNKKLVIQ